VRNPHEGLPVVLGDFTSMPVLLSVLGLAAISGLEKRGTHGGVLLVIILISVWGVIFDPGIQYQGIFARPNFAESSVFGSMDVMGALTPLVLPSVLALVLTSVFDATATIRAVAAQANLLDDKGRIENGNKALSSDSISSIFAGVAGGTPAAVYIESAAGTLAGGRTGLTATVVGVFFLCMIFLAPLAALVPSYAAAPALMYVGLLMMGNIVKIDFDDKVDALSGLTCAVFIVLTGNIVTGIMLGFATLVIGRVVAGEFNRLNFGIVITAVILVGFYLGGWDI